MAENNVYRGLILRDETIVTSQYAGSLNYYVRESSRVGYGDLICSVDESGSVSQKINDVSADASNLDAEGLLEIENDISDYENSYQAQTFYNIYSFKENIDSALNEAFKSGSFKRIIGLYIRCRKWFFLSYDHNRYTWDPLFITRMDLKIRPRTIFKRTV